MFVSQHAYKMLVYLFCFNYWSWSFKAAKGIFQGNQEVVHSEKKIVKKKILLKSLQGS